jgi:hemerythrin-like domain-containing protein
VGTPGPYQTDTSDMLAVHRAIRGALDAASTYVPHAKTQERVEVVASFYDNVVEFLHVHHQGEDEVLYPLLEERCPHEKGGLEEIDAQHKLLDEPMGKVRDAIEAWRSSPNDDTANALISAVTLVDSILTPHLADEEALVVPLASEHLTPEEWGQLPAHGMATFNRDKPWLPIGLLFEQLNDAQRAGMLGGMPEPVRELWTTQWSPAYDAFIAEVRS